MFLLFSHVFFSPFSPFFSIFFNFIFASLISDLVGNIIAPHRGICICIVPQPVNNHLSISSTIEMNEAYPPMTCPNFPLIFLISILIVPATSLIFIYIYYSNKLSWGCLWLFLKSHDIFAQNYISRKSIW